MIDGIGWIMGYGVLVAVAYYERRWRYLQMYITLPYVLIFIIFSGKYVIGQGIKNVGFILDANGYLIGG